MFLVESVQKNSHTELVVFYRDKNNKKQIKIVKDFKPYFYIEEKEYVPDDYRITKVETGYKSILNEPLKKIIVRKSSDVTELRFRFHKTYEADILFTHRYIIDKIGEVEPYPLNTLYLDIETNSEEVFPNMEDPDQEIVCLTMEDTFTDKKITLFYQSEKASKTVKETKDTKIFKTEEELLNAFIFYFNKLDPDIISGWNVEEFDLVYLIRRMKKLGVKYEKLSPMNAVFIDDRWNDVNIKGRIIMDMMKSYMHYRKLTNQGRAESYSLEYTSQNILGTGKLEHKEFFNYMWLHKPDELIEYNRRDNELVKEINEKLKILDFFNVIRCKACSHLRNIFHSSMLLDGLLLRMVKDNIVLPSKKKNPDDKFSGAKVIEPKAGLYKNVLALDIKGMYPNIIKTFNVSYETFDHNGEIKLYDGVAFRKEEGIIPKAVKELENERVKNKMLQKEAKTEEEREMYGFRQYGVKVLTNAFFGYLGFPGGRLYRREIANSITTMGRNILEKTRNVLKTKGYDVIYGDTDSIHVLAKEKSLFGMIKEGNNLIVFINNIYEEYSKTFGAENPTLEMEFEKIFKRIIFVSKKGVEIGAKKKYAYLPLWEEGKDVKNKIEYTGFSNVRSDSPRIAREIEKNVLESIIRGKTKEEIVEYIKIMEKKIRKKEIPDEEIAFPKGISEHLKDYGIEKKREDGTKYSTGTPPVVCGAKYSNKYLGTQFGRGSKPKWIYVKSVPFGYPNTHVISFKEFIPKGFEPDYDKMLDRIFKMKLENIFHAAGFGKFPNIDSSIKSLDMWGIK